MFHNYFIFHKCSFLEYFIVHRRLYHNNVMFDFSTPPPPLVDYYYKFMHNRANRDKRVHARLYCLLDSRCCNKGETISKETFCKRYGSDVHL